ncbi:MAG TPA: hypothetical protein PKD45_10830 [Flavobacteriales bacterium]|nr:hypothetical protein [Flavobacteriales bacterium]
MIESFRTALLITLSILVVVILVRRFKQYIRLHHLPVPQHVKVLDVQVLYHPARVRVAMDLPEVAQVHPAMLNAHHAPLKQWTSVQMEKGNHVLELQLDHGLEGVFYLEIATDTQRTVRRFTVRQG